MRKMRGLKREVAKMKKSIAIDSALDIDFLLKERFFYFEIEDWYGPYIYRRGKTRKFILENLFKIHYKWYQELKELSQPFYLAIWLHDPRLLVSEVVCAIGEKIAYYEDEAFMKSNKPNELDTDQYGSLSTDFAQFEWARKVDLAYFLDWEKRDNKKRQIIHTIEREQERLFFYSQGDVWVGKIKSQFSE